MRTRNCEDSNTGQTISSLECYGADVDYGICVLQDCPSKCSYGLFIFSNDTIELTDGIITIIIIP